MSDPGHSYLTASKGIRSWLFTTDHKRIGILYAVAVAIFFLLGGLFAILVRTELAAPGETIMDQNTYNEVFTLHGVIMVFLVIIPAIPGILGNFVLPIQIGAKDVAFPRLNLFSWYIFMIGAVLALSGWLVVGQVDTGLTFYTPCSA